MLRENISHCWHAAVVPLCSQLGYASAVVTTVEPPIKSSRLDSYLQHTQRRHFAARRNFVAFEETPDVIVCHVQQLLCRLNSIIIDYYHCSLSILT